MLLPLFIFVTSFNLYYWQSNFQDHLQRSSFISFFPTNLHQNFTYVYISNFWRKFASYVNVYFFNFVKVITNTDFLFRFQYFSKFSIFVFKFKYMKHYIFFLYLNLNRHSLSTFWKSDRSFHMIDFFKLNFNIQKEKCLNFYLQ